MVWCSPGAVNKYFNFSGRSEVYSLLRTPDDCKYRAHSGGIQLRYSFDGVNPTRPFTDPRKFQVRKVK